MNPEAILRHYDDGTLWSTDPARVRRNDVAAAYQESLAVRALREARGERPLGYKIGFTNRTIWERYAVFAPIWGPIWDTTVVIGDESGVLDLRGTSQPRLEPEIAFGMSGTPPEGATLEQLFDCVEWLAPSFEVVQSHQPDWKFTAAETVADGALHARLLVGRRTPVRAFAGTGAALDDRLAATHVRLYREDVMIDQGRGTNVLDGPLHALHHFVREMQACPGARSLLKGEIVTTGTWTDAWPIEQGQTWRSEFDAPFLPLRVTMK